MDCDDSCDLCSCANSTGGWDWLFLHCYRMSFQHAATRKKEIKLRQLPNADRHQVDRVKAGGRGLLPSGHSTESRLVGTWPAAPNETPPRTSGFVVRQRQLVGDASAEGRSATRPLKVHWR